MIPRPVHLTRGARLGPYEIQSALGAGGMGEVYRARDTRLDRTVAIKVLSDTLAADPQFRSRFDREARLVSQLSHPYICTLYDIGEHQPEGSASPAAFLVMEYLEGRTLADRGLAGPIPVNEAVGIFCQIAEALRAAHDRTIIHRDLKPGNIMLTVHGAKLMDFGLAKSIAKPEPVGDNVTTLTRPMALTAHGALLGTLPYMAPEQLEGCEPDFRADLFAFGTTMHETLTGVHPFSGASTAATIAAILKSEAPRLTDANLGVPIELDRVIWKCLQKRREDRYQSTADLCVDLRNLERASEPQSVLSAAVNAMSAPVSTVTGAQRLWSWYNTFGCALTPVLIYLIWHAWALADVAWRHAAFVGAITGLAMNFTVRTALLAFFFATDPESFQHQLVRLDKWRRLGAALCIAAVIPIGLSLALTHVATAAIVVGCAIASLTSSELIEPALSRLAFGDRRS